MAKIRQKKGGPPASVVAKQKNARGKKAAKSSAAADSQAEKNVLVAGISSEVPNPLHKAFRAGKWQVKHIDPNAQLNPDFCGVITDMKQVKSGSMDAVWCPHILQRFFCHDTATGLRECFRVIRDGGFLLVAVPNAQKAAAWLAHSRHQEALYNAPAGSVTALDVLYGFSPAIAKGNMHMMHRTAFTPESLGTALRDAGFTNIKVQAENFEITAVGYKLNYSDPARVERIAMLAPKDPKTPEVASPSASAPAHINNARPGEKLDELDVEPVIYNSPSL